MSKLLVATFLSVSTLLFSCNGEGSSNGSGDAVDSDANSTSENLDAQAEETQQNLDAQTEQIQNDADSRLNDPEPIEETSVPTLEEDPVEAEDTSSNDSAN